MLWKRATRSDGSGTGLTQWVAVHNENAHHELDPGPQHSSYQVGWPALSSFVYWRMHLLTPRRPMTALEWGAMPWPAQPAPLLP